MSALSRSRLRMTWGRTFDGMCGIRVTVREVDWAMMRHRVSPV